MKKKRAFIINRAVTVLILGLILSILFMPGIVKAEKSHDGETVDVVIPAASNQYIAHKARVEQFEEDTGIEVNYIGIPYGNIRGKLMTEGVSMRGKYDVVHYNSTWMASLSKFLQPLGSYVQEDNYEMNKFPEVYQRAVKFDGNTYGVPYRGHVEVFYYRKDLFSDLDLEVPENWGDLMEVGKVIQDKTDLHGAAMYGSAGQAQQNKYCWAPLLWSNSGEIFNESWEPVFNNEEGVEATQRWVNLMNEIGAPGSKAFNEQDAQNSLAQGKSATMWGWWWMYRIVNSEDTATEEVVGNIDLAPMPKWEGEKRAGAALLLPVGIMESSKHKGAAWEYIKWATQREIEKDIVMDTWTGEAPSGQGTIVVVHKKNLKDPEINEVSNGLYEKALGTIEGARMFPQIPEWPEISEVIGEALSSISSGAKVETQLDNAAKQVRGIMKRAGYYD